MADIHQVPKDNQINSTANWGTLQSGTGGWDTAAPTTTGTPQPDPYSPGMVGSTNGSEHNSGWLEATDQS